MARRADLGLAGRWRWRLERFERSPLSIARFCEAEGVSEASFYQWRRKLTSSGGKEAAKQTPRQVPHATPLQSPFAPVRLIAGASLTAHLPGGTRLEIPLGDLSAAQLAIETLVRADVANIQPQRDDLSGGAAC